MLRIDLTRVENGWAEITFRYGEKVHLLPYRHLDNDPGGNENPLDTSPFARTTKAGGARRCLGLPPKTIVLD